MYMVCVTAVFIEGIMPVNGYLCVCVCVCVCAAITAAVFMIPVQTEGCSSALLRLLFKCWLTEILISQQHKMLFRLKCSSEFSCAFFIFVFVWYFLLFKTSLYDTLYRNTVQYISFYRVFDVYSAWVPSLTSIILLISLNISRVKLSAVGSN